MYYEKYFKSNSVDWVLFIHGLGGSSKTWKYQLDAFKDYNILCVDLQGHGQSAYVKSDNPEKAAIYAIHDILQQEDIKIVNIVSLSLGTIIAFEFAYTYPDMVSTLTLAGCVLNLNFGKRMLVRFVNMLKYLMPIRLMYQMFAKVVMPKENHKTSRKIFVRESLKMTKKAFSDWISVLASSQSKLKKYISAINEKRLPVLMVTGEEDYLFVNGVKKLKFKIDNCKEEIINKCGHVCSIDKKQQFNEIVLKFLNKKESAMI